LSTNSISSFASQEEEGEEEDFPGCRRRASRSCRARSRRRRDRPDVSRKNEDVFVVAADEDDSTRRAASFINKEADGIEEAARQRRQHGRHAETAAAATRRGPAMVKLTVTANRCCGASSSYTQLYCERNYHYSISFPFEALVHEPVKDTRQSTPSLSLSLSHLAIGRADNDGHKNFGLLTAEHAPLDARRRIEVTRTAPSKYFSVQQ
jgi:hypothetical protein